MEPRTPKSAAGPGVVSPSNAKGYTTDSTKDNENKNGLSRANTTPAPVIASEFASSPRTELNPSRAKKNRNKKRKGQRQSFAVTSETSANNELSEVEHRTNPREENRGSTASSTYYRIRSRNRSTASADSEALLDHRNQELPFRSRRRSASNNFLKHTRSNDGPTRSQLRRQGQSNMDSPSRKKLVQIASNYIDEEPDDHDVTDKTPLLPQKSRPMNVRTATGHSSQHLVSDFRRGSVHSPNDENDEDYDINNPPSMPGSPKLGTLDDVMIAEEFSKSPRDANNDAIIDIDGDGLPQPEHYGRSNSSKSKEKRHTKNLAEMDVCFPGDTGMSEMGDDDFHPADCKRSPSRRRKRRNWPDLSILDDWSQQEKEERDADHIAAKKMTEPVMVGGRLRNVKQAWHAEVEDVPYRYTYFNETFDATIHSRSISELCQFGATFHDLFNPDPPELSDTSEDEEHTSNELSPGRAGSVIGGGSVRGRASVTNSRVNQTRAQDQSGSLTPGKTVVSQPATPLKNKRYGARPTFWLDVLSPTEAEMKILARTFGIHQLTVEDVLLQEPREKVELFQNYYFVNYRSFEQDRDSHNYMDPVNIYVIVFRDGVLSFHFSLTPHPANVRRRIRQLNDYMSPSADWISYAIIDDVTDAFAPLVQRVEDEVDDIDESILALHHPSENDNVDNNKTDKQSLMSEKRCPSIRSEKSISLEDSSGRMLRRIGECRKKVMSLYRLLGNKADVIKGFAKRCTEQWQVAPRSEIGLYLGDIQDHIVTMTGNLSHYENLLSRAHSNYLAQINIRTSERAEQTNDVLNKLTVLSTIVLPLNIVTGIWGMNCWIPGLESVEWFFGIIGGMLLFSVICLGIARRKGLI